MTPPITFSFDTPGDAERAAELRRVKALATLVLASTLGLFIVAKIFLNVHPVFGFIAAFAEAATIGGLADWYAVVALFKRPLGLPIPHTAIIQSNQARIADKLGEFIQVHFLSADPVEAKLKEIDFGSFVADWLRDRKRSDDLARFALRRLGIGGIRQSLRLDTTLDMREQRLRPTLHRRFVHAELPGDRADPAGLVEQ